MKQNHTYLWKKWLNSWGDNYSMTRGSRHFNITSFTTSLYDHCMYKLSKERDTKLLHTCLEKLRNNEMSFVKKKLLL